MKYLKYIFLLVLFILYLFHISFYPLPTVLRTRLMIGVMGIISIVIVLINKRKLIIYPEAITIVLCFLSIIAASIISISINSTLDFWFIQYSIQSLIFLVAAYFTINISCSFLGISFKFISIIKLITWAVVVHNLIAALMFISPSVNSFFISIQNFSALAGTQVSNSQRFSSRFIGLGIGSFFAGGILCGYAILVNSYLIKTSHKKSDLILYCITFVFLTISSLFIARTSLIGTILGVCYVLWPLKYRITINKRTLLKNFLFYISICIVITALATYLIIFPPNWIGGSSTYRAFEMFYNYSNGEGFTSRSTDELENLFIFPDNLKTWLVGDGLFSTNNGMSFYKGTDVGYLRSIFYFGIIGTLCYWVTQITIAFIIGKLSNNILIKRLFILSIVYTIILNFKGLADINYFLFLFVCYFLTQKRHAQIV